MNFLSRLCIVVLVAFFATSSAMAADQKYDLESVIAINQKVHRMLRPGVGLPSGTPIKDVLAYGEGHCGNFVQLLVRELLMKGFPINHVRVASVTSRYLNAMHARVDVKIDNKWYLFDPMFNAYFPYGFTEILENPQLNTSAIGPYDRKSPYFDPLLFSSVERVDIFWGLDLFEPNLTEKASVVASTKFDDGYGPENVTDDNFGSYYSSRSYQFPQSLDFDLGKEQKFYRFKIVWYSGEIAGKSFQIEIEDSSGKWVKIADEKNYVDPENDGVYEIILKEPVTARNVRFTMTDAYGQSRIVMRDFKIYEY